MAHEQNGLIQVQEHGLFQVRLPRPEEIPVAKIRAGWEKVLAADAFYANAVTERELAERAIGTAELDDQARSVELAGKGESDPEPRKFQLEAAETFTNKRAGVEPARIARQLAYNELRDLVVEHRAEWVRFARDKVAASRDKISGALKTLEVEEGKLRANMGALELLDQDPLPGVLAFDWTVGAISLFEGIKHTNEALVEVHQRIEGR